MLRLTTLSVGTGHVVAALEGPFPHYIRTDAAAHSREVGYSWGVHTRHADAIRLHHAFVIAARDQLCARFGIPRQRTVLVGFSQSVGTELPVDRHSSRRRRRGDRPLRRSTE